MTNREKALAFLGAAYAQLVEAVEYFDAAENHKDTFMQECGIESIDLARKNLDCADHAVRRLAEREKRALQQYREDDDRQLAELEAGDDK